MGSSYVWRAAIITALLNMLLNPTVVLLGRLDVSFMTVRAIMVDVALSSVGVALAVTFFGVRRVRRALRHQEQVLPHSGTASEKRLIALLPGNAWLFSLVLGVAAGIVLTLALTLCSLVGLDGLAFTDFGVLIGLYTGALAFLVMRWTILRELAAYTVQHTRAAR